MSVGALSAFLASVTWALGSARYSQLSRKHSPFSINFTRAMVALPLFGLASLGTSSDWAHLNGTHYFWFTVSMIASYGLGDVLFLRGTQKLGVPTALAIASCYPLWTSLAGLSFRHEFLTVLQWCGLVLAVGGVAFVIVTQTPQERSSLTGVRSGRTIQQGVLLALATSFFWATNSYATSQAGMGLSVSVANTVRMSLALLLITVFFLFSGGALRALPLPGVELKRSLGIIVLESFGGSFFYLYGLTHAPLAVGATLTSLAPVIAVPVAVAFRMEKFSFWRTFGILMVVMGLSLLMGSH